MEWINNDSTDEAWKRYLDDERVSVQWSEYELHN